MTPDKIPYLETESWWMIDPKKFIKSYIELTGKTEEEGIKHWCRCLGLEYIPPSERDDL